ncbi:MAG: phosphotransferase family protein [Acidimicrobiales bacterium]
MGEDSERLQTSTRDYGALRDQLTEWLATQLPDRSPQLSALEVPATNGMSSETVLFDLTLGPAGESTVQRCVARIAPPLDAVPVFAVYDLPKQYETMCLVEQRTAVPVPTPLWVEGDSAAVGAPFFIMERVDGVVPPDVMPYPFGDNWLYDATRDDQMRVQAAAVDVLCQLHTIEGRDPAVAFLQLDRPEPTPLSRHLANEGAYYEWVVGDGPRIPLLERALRWLGDNLPAEGRPALSWGDSRIGNMMFRDFEPVAVLDWEMAAVAPREVDLMWMAYIHAFFNDLAAQLGAPGMPHYMRRDDLASHYERLSDYTPRDLNWFSLYSALRYGSVSARVQQRSIHFGQAQPPDDPDDLVMHRAALEAMLAGTYW